MTVDELKRHLALPVIGAPMFLKSGVDLVVAQCCNGVIGAFPALNARPAEELDVWLGDIKSRLSAFENETGKVAAPYAVNLVVHASNTRLDEDLATVIRHRVPLVITSLSAPDKVVDAVHAYGGLVFHDVITRRHAQKAAAAGVDGLILVSAGAGGHGGRLNPFALIGEVRKIYDGAIILAGAIASGPAILAAEALGADFAYIGTAFLSSTESMASDAHKQMIVDCSADDILYTPYFSATYGNYLIPSIKAAGVDLEEAANAKPRNKDFKVGKERPNAWKDICSAGQGVGQITAVAGVSEIVRQLKADYDAARNALLSGWK
ncbi:nitronate monooxygenase family protein [Thalassospiraceae bacterium LMO-JJ14]|nr:nitronate monooxygenase family protein [Thalassospiraceae bacterium LMO-JJ14]